MVVDTATRKPRFVRSSEFPETLFHLLLQRQLRSRSRQFQLTPELQLLRNLTEKISDGPNANRVKHFLTLFGSIKQSGHEWFRHAEQ